MLPLPRVIWESDGGRYKDRTCDPYDVKASILPQFTTFQGLNGTATNVRVPTKTEQNQTYRHNAATRIGG